MDERLKILKILEQGRITAEDALRLLEALEQGKHPKPKSRVLGVKRELEPKKRISVSTIWGDITVRGWEGDRIVFHPPIDVSKIGENEESVNIQHIGNICLDVPKSAGLQLTSIDGDVNVEGVEGRIEVETFHGDIKVNFGKVEESEIRTKFGDITLIVPKEESFKLELNGGGEIECNLPLEEVERGPTYLEGVLNKGGKLLSVTTEEDGDIRIRGR